MVESLVVGVAASLVASFVWVVLLRLLRPKVDIATLACFDPSDDKLKIKVINRSRRAIVHIHVEVATVMHVSAAGGLVGMRHVIPLFSPEPLAIEGYRKGNDDQNAYRFAVKIERKDLQDLIASNSSNLRFSVYCEDELSGLGRLFQHAFHDASEIVCGSYAKGQDFNVVLATGDLIPTGPANH